jgi:hypothetical protein
MGYAPATDLEQIATPSDELVESWLAQLHRAGAPQARRS